MLMRRSIEAPVEAAEKLLLQIDSIFLGSLSGKGARRVIREGKSALRELMGLKNGEASINALIESLTLSIQMAKKEIENEKPQ